MWSMFLRSSWWQHARVWTSVDRCNQPLPLKPSIVWWELLVKTMMKTDTSNLNLMLCGNYSEMRRWGLLNISINTPVLSVIHMKILPPPPPAPRLIAGSLERLQNLLLNIIWPAPPPLQETTSKYVCGKCRKWRKMTYCRNVKCRILTYFDVIWRYLT